MDKVRTAMRTLRLSLGLSQRRLARRTDLPESDISKIETGRMIPYPLQARRIARALGVRVEDLFQTDESGMPKCED